MEIAGGLPAHPSYCSSEHDPAGGSSTQSDASKDDEGVVEDGDGEEETEKEESAAERDNKKDGEKEIGADVRWESLETRHSRPLCLRYPQLLVSREDGLVRPLPTDIEPSK